jgi:hypothetical protein
LSTAIWPTMTDPSVRVSSKPRRRSVSSGIPAVMVTRTRALSPKTNWASSTEGLPPAFTRAIRDAMAGLALGDAALSFISLGAA